MQSEGTMAHYDQLAIETLLPDSINGKTHEELKEETRARDKRMGAHYVDGVKLPFVVPRSNLEALKTFEVRDDDVFLVTYPRSGTHWALEILQYILNDGRDDWDRSAMKSGLDVTLAPNTSQLSNTEPGYKIYEAMKSPRCLPSHLFECHLPPQVWSKQAKVIYLGRNSKDTLVSMYNFIANMGVPAPSFDEFLWSFYAEEMVYGSWFDHVLGYWRHKDDSNVLFLKYEDLHKDLRESLCKLAKHVGKDLSDDVIDYIMERVTLQGMQKTYQKLAEKHGEAERRVTHVFGSPNTPHVRKGKVGNWKNVFTVAQSELFDKIYALRMQGTDLEFEHDL